MKKLTNTLLIAVLFTACSSGPSYTENEHLGKFPSIFMERSIGMNKIREEMKLEGNSIKTPDDYEKIQKKYGAKEEKLKAETTAMAVKELEILEGKPVPFQFDYEDPHFQVRSASIAGGHTETGALTIEVVIGAKHTMKASPNTYLYYLIMSKDGTYTNKFQINPFVAMQIFTNSTFPHGTVIEEGDTCSPEGSHLMLYCGSYDYTNFSHIQFISKDTYNSLK